MKGHRDYCRKIQSQPLVTSCETGPGTVKQPVLQNFSSFESTLCEALPTALSMPRGNLGTVAFYNPLDADARIHAWVGSLGLASNQSHGGLSRSVLTGTNRGQPAGRRDCGRLAVGTR